MSIERKPRTPATISKMGKARIKGLRKAAHEFQRDMSIIYGKTDYSLCENSYALCEEVQDLDVQINDDLDRIEESVNIILAEGRSL